MDQLLTPEEAGAILKVSATRVRDFRLRGDLKLYPAPSGRMLYKESEVRALAIERENNPIPPGRPHKIELAAA